MPAFHSTDLTLQPPHSGGQQESTGRGKALPLQQVCLVHGAGRRQRAAGSRGVPALPRGSACLTLPPTRVFSRLALSAFLRPVPGRAHPLWASFRFCVVASCHHCWSLSLPRGASALPLVCSHGCISCVSGSASRSALRK